MTNTANANDMQPRDWKASLPRPEYRSYDRVSFPADCGWYEVYLVLPGVYAIYEPGHIEEVISFLILGSEAAVLWDTGMGFVPLRPLVEKLTGLPVTAINSHNHFDHVGGNWEFGAVYGRLCPGNYDRAASGYCHGFLAPMLGPESLARPLPPGVDAAVFSVRPWRAKWLEAGQTFDLGDRKLETLYTPGHSPDSVMLLDRGAGILFTGDAVYPAALYAHFDDAMRGKSSVSDYSATMTAISDLAPALSHLCCSHNLPVNPPSLLVRIADGFDRILSGQSRCVTDECGFSNHAFEGFSIITPRRL